MNRAYQKLSRRGKGGPTATSNLHFPSRAPNATPRGHLPSAKKKLPSLLPEAEPDKPLPAIAHKERSRCRRARCSSRADCLRAHPESIRIEPRGFHRRSPEPKPKLELRAPSLPGPAPSSTPSPVPRLAWHATRSNSYVVSTRCLHRTVDSGTAETAPSRKNQKDSTAGAEEVPQSQARCLRPPLRGGAPSSPRGGDSPREEMAPRGAAGPASLLPRVRRGPRWPGNRKELASLGHPRAPPPRGARPRLRPPAQHPAPPRTPDRAGAGCHRLPPPSPATTAERSRPSLTVPAAADRASQVRRLHSPGRRQPPLPRAEGGSAGKVARALPCRPHPRDSGKAVTWRAGGVRTRPGGGTGEGRRWPPAQRDLGNSGDLFRTG